MFFPKNSQQHKYDPTNVLNTNTLSIFKLPTEKVYTKTIQNYHKGKLHSINDKPAVILCNIRFDMKCVTKKWYKHGLLHRLNGPAVINNENTTIEILEWYKHDLLHREDGPAVISFNGINEWYFNGKLHRENGPAIDNIETDCYKEYWYNGIKYSKENYFNEIKVITAFKELL